jgi:outer membrane protein TolC
MDEIINGIVLSVKQFYYQVLYAQKVEKVAIESLEQCNKHLEKARGFYETGKSPKFDVTKAEIDCANARLDLIKARNDILVALLGLNNTMGISDMPEYTVEDVFAERYPEIKFEMALESAHSNRPDIKIATIQKKSAEYSVSLARKGYYPSLSGSAGYGWSGSDLDSGGNSWNVGLVLNIPLFDGFSTKYGIEEALASLKAVVSEENNLKQSVFLEVKQAYLNFMESVEKMPVAELAVRQAKENLELANGRYEAGVGSPLEVTDARLSYSEARNSYMQAIYEYHDYRAILDKSMGVQ